MISGGAIAGR